MSKFENSLWCGQLIKDMTREELIDVIEELCLELNQQRSDHKRTLDVWSAAQKARWRR